MIHLRELLETTGYIRGGCSPIGMKRAFPTFIDESCRRFDRIYISAGVRGLQIALAPDDLIRFARLGVASLTGPTESGEEGK